MVNDVEILHIKENPAVRDLAKLLEEENERFSVETATSVDGTLARISDSPLDCVISDYNMPGMDGLEFFEAVRDHNPDLPFILLNGKGSEGVASESIAAGVTDYFQNGSASEQYDLLANRIQMAVRAQRDAQKASRQEELMRLTEFAGETGGFELDRESGKLLLTPGTGRIIGHPETTEMDLQQAIGLFHPEDRDEIQQTFDKCFQSGEELQKRWRLQPGDGDERLLDFTITPVVEDGEVTKLRGAGHDITEQVAHERDLKRYRTVFNELPDPVVVYDEKGQYDLVNDAAAEIRDIPREELRGTNSPYLEQIQEENPDEYEALLEGSRDTLRAELFDAFPGRGKRTLQCDLTRVSTETESAGIAIVTRDITERKERKRDLQRIEQAVESAGHAIYITDTDGNIEYVNPAFEEVTGFAQSEAVGETPKLLDSGQMSEEYFEELWNTVNSGEIWEEEIINRRKNGETYVAMQTIAPVGDDDDIHAFVAIQDDITERKEREDQLRRRTKAIDEAPVGVSITDPDREDNPLIYVNDAFVELTGYSRDKILGQNCRFLQGEETDPDRVARLREAIDAEDPVSIALRNYRKDGTEFWNQLAIAPVKNDAGDVVNYIGFQQDVTEQTRREEQLEVIDRVLRHNLRNEMNVIQGQAEIIHSQMSGEVADYAGKILDKSDQLMELAEKEQEITGLLREEPVQEEISVGERLQQIASTIGSEYPDATITVECPAGVTVHATKRFDQAISELVRNGIIHNDSPSPEVVVSVTQSDETARIEIADTGPPIPEIERAILFDDEERTQLLHGTGLGLWFVKLVTARSGGTLTVEENSPVGNIVGIELSC